MLVRFVLVRDMSNMLSIAVLRVPTGYCKASSTSGCDPLSYVNCSSTDEYQFFYYSSSNSSFENAVTGYCLDVWSGTGPSVLPFSSFLSPTLLDW